MDYATLTTELAKPQYAGLSDEAAAEALRALTVTVRELVPLWKIKKALIESGEWPVTSSQPAT